MAKSAVSSPFDSGAPFEVRPIGFVRTAMRSKFQAPHQPSDPSSKPGYIELLPESNFEAALHDLSGFSHIWLVWMAHRNKTWRPKVLPPRGSAARRGVFATRSPHRPNAICLTAVPLLNISGRFLEIGQCDLVDETPILDIKPYLPEIDSFPEARTGWVGEIQQELAQPPRFKITVSQNAEEQLGWLKRDWNVEFLDRASQLLERDPTPHRTRRITRVTGGFRMGCGPWRILYSVSGDMVSVNAIVPGYPRSSLEDPGYDCIADRDAQIAFYNRYGGS